MAAKKMNFYFYICNFMINIRIFNDVKRFFSKFQNYTESLTVKASNMY